MFHSSPRVSLVQVLPVLAMTVQNSSILVAFVHKGYLHYETAFLSFVPLPSATHLPCSPTFWDICAPFTYIGSWSRHIYSASTTCIKNTQVSSYHNFQELSLTRFNASLRFGNCHRLEGLGMLSIGKFTTISPLAVEAHAQFNVPIGRKFLGLDQ